MPVEDLEKFVDSLQARIQDLMAHEVDSRWVGEQVMGFLRDHDPVAYVRFASVYRQFKDVQDFVAELRPMLEESRHSE